MTHDSRHPQGAPRPRHRAVEHIADIDDLMRQLSDILDLHIDCRRTACQTAGRCKGGEGPYCFHANRAYIAQSIAAGLADTRRFWSRQRALAREAERGE